METLSATSTLVLGAELGAELKVFVFGRRWRAREQGHKLQEFYGGKRRLARSPAAPGVPAFPKSCWRWRINSVESISHRLLGSTKPARGPDTGLDNFRLLVKTEPSRVSLRSGADQTAGFNGTLASEEQHVFELLRVARTAIRRDSGSPLPVPECCT